MARLTPTQIAEKWNRNAGAAGQSYVDGVNAVNENPMDKAIAAIPTMVSNFNQAASDGTIERGMRRWSLSEWKAVTASKGQTRYPQGIRDGQARFQTFITQFMPFVDDAVAQLPPRGSLAENIQRAVQMMNRLSEFRLT